MPYPRTIRNFNAFIDGRSYFGRVVKATLPELALATQDFRGGGMDGSVAVDMGMEPLSAEVELREWSQEAFARWGRRTRLVLRAGELGEEDFEAKSLVFTIGGRVTATQSGDLQGGQDTTLTMRWGVDHYRIEHDGKTLVEIDVERAIRIVDGKDQLKSLRRAMGI